MIVLYLLIIVYIKFLGIAPPPPATFNTDFNRPTRRYPPLEGSPPSSSNRRQRYSPSPPPSNRIRRVAPPIRSPERDVGGPRHRRGDEWADPWMRGEQNRTSNRKRSYSSGSSRSSSSRSSSRSRSRSPKRRRRGRSSSGRSSSSRSRSSTPEGIPRRNARRSNSPDDSRNTAPLQKRLMNLSKIKKEKEDKDKNKDKDKDKDKDKQNANNTNLSAADAELVGQRRNQRKSSERSRSLEKRKRSTSSRRSSRSSSSSRSSTSSSKRRRSRSGLVKAVPPEEPIRKEVPVNPSTPPESDEVIQQPKQAIRMTLKPSVVSKTLNKNVLEKMGTDATEILENAKAKREENKMKKASEIKKEKKEKKEKKSAADRREELLKQLKAVENAIAKKRTKISQESSKR